MFDKIFGACWPQASATSRAPTLGAARKQLSRSGSDSSTGLDSGWNWARRLAQHASLKRTPCRSNPSHSNLTWSPSRWAMSTSTPPRCRIR